MIKLIEIKTCTAFWDIDGTVLRFQRRKRVDDELTGRTIERYRELLLNETYKSCPQMLRDIACILTDNILVRIGIEVYQKQFLKMFEYYSKLYVEQWEQAGKCFISNKTAMFPVFEFMFRNRLVEQPDSPITILRDIPCDSKIFLNIFEECFSSFWAGKIREKVLKQETLAPIRERIGPLRTTQYLCFLPETVITDYLKTIAGRFTRQRRLITTQNFCLELLGSDTSISGPRFHPRFVTLVAAAVRCEFEIQCQKFIAENHLQFDMSSDKWTLFHRHGPSLHRETIDFTGIHSPSLRLEIKYFMKHRYYSITADKDRAITTIAYAANLLTDNNPSIRFFADVDDVDVRSLYMSMERRYGQTAGGKSVSNIMRVFSTLSVLMEYLMSDHRDEAMRSPVPHDNPFSRYRFHNAKDYKVRTAVIPEAVAEQIDAHLDELDPVQALLYRIFSATGMRMKEVLFLESDCLEPSQYEGVVQLKYKQYKTLTARRKAGVPDYHRVLILKVLADEISGQIHKTKEWRKELGVPYLFVNKRPNFRASMISMSNYLLVINRLIEKYDIRDENGQLWHFTSKQQRKTLTVTLIENGASVDELAYWLGHLSRSTASNYYAEVRKMKLAELNTSFFRKKFDLLLSDEQLAEYTEEERRLLYMDFRLEQRRVEFGFCLKKLADGGCTSRSSLINCVNCKNLCTGPKYLPYWQSLMSGQREVVDSLLAAYAEAGIIDYQEFREYRQATFLLNCYENIVNAIEGGASV